MYAVNKKAKKAFKPPGQSGVYQQPRSSGSKKGRPVTKLDMENLKALEQLMDEEIKRLEGKGHKPEQLQEYIDLLHEYNDAKDMAQIFMGRLAVYECVTYREMAQRYNAPESD